MAKRRSSVVLPAPFVAMTAHFCHIETAYDKSCNNVAPSRTTVTFCSSMACNLTWYVAPYQSEEL